MKFIFEGTLIADPTMDETGRFKVDPAEYYGEAYLEELEQNYRSSI